MSRQVVVTGLGVCCPLGIGTELAWQALLDGESGVRTLPDRCTKGFDLPVTFAGLVPDGVEDLLARTEVNRLDRAGQISLIAARQAVEDAGDIKQNPERTAVSWGTGIGCINTVLSAWDRLAEKGPGRVLPMTVPMLMPNAPAVAVGMKMQAKAGIHTSVSACAASTESIAVGFDMIRSNKADVVIAGGSESAINPLTISAFASLSALSTYSGNPEHASRPFSKNRDGFVVSEGAAVLILEEKTRAKARGAKTYAEISGALFNSDAHHITAPEPDGKMATTAMRNTLKMGGLSPEEITYVNAHATATILGDISEYKALLALFEDHLANVYVSATKASTGHLLGGAGALEAVFTVKAVSESIIPPTINCDEQDPDIQLRIQRQPKKLSRPFAAISNSFGFGGHNAVVAFTPTD